MKQYLKFFILAIVPLIVIGCGSTAPPLLIQPSTNIAAIDGFLLEKTNAGSSKLLVAQGRKHNIDESFQRMFSNNITDIIVESGSEVIDRGLAARFMSEIQLKENLSENYQPYTGPVEAKYVIIPTVTSVGSDGTYQKATTTRDKEGNTTRYPAECNYKGVAKANLQIRELPSMTKIMSINMIGNSSIDIKNPRNRYCKETKILSGATAAAVTDLLEKGDDDYVILSKYVGSQGIITGAKSANGKLYFQTNLGRLNGAKEDAPVAIYQNIDDELVLIAEGEMMDAKNVLRKISFIKVDSKDAPMLKKGMIIMLSGKCKGIVCKIKSAADKLKKSM